MNIALPAFLILVFVVPGVVLRYAYLRGSYSAAPISFRSVLDELAIGTVFAFPLHSTWFALSQLIGPRLFGLTPDLKSYLYLVIGNFGDKAVYLPEVVSSIYIGRHLIAIYFSTLCLFAFGLGLLVHFLVRDLSLDVKIPLLRFNNKWQYIMSGDVTQTSNVLETVTKPDMTVITFPVDTKDQTYLYRGIVVGFDYNSDGNLSSLILTNVYRRPLSKDRRRNQKFKLVSQDSIDTRYYAIEGNMVVFDCSSISNYTIQYYKFEEID